MDGALFPGIPAAPPLSAQTVAALSPFVMGQDGLPTQAQEDADQAAKASSPATDDKGAAGKRKIWLQRSSMWCFADAEFVSNFRIVVCMARTCCFIAARFFTKLCMSVLC